MDKSDFYKHFDDNIERDLVDKLYNKFVLALKGISLCTKEFYTINIYNILKRICTENGINCNFFGGFQYAERGIITFNNADATDIPIKFIEITNSSKFSTLLHKDYLGTILSLGIERYKLGDLVVQGDVCFLAISPEIMEILFSELNKVKKAPVTIKELDNESLLPNHNFEESVMTITSLRLDSIVSSLANISRAKAVIFVDGGNVSVNYSIIKEKSKTVEIGDVITIRKVGKFIVDGLIGFSKSGKSKVIIKKFT